VVQFVVAALEAALVQGMRMGGSVSELGERVRSLGLARDDRVVSALATLRQAPQQLDAATSPDGQKAGGQRSHLTSLTSHQSRSHRTSVTRGEASEGTLSSPSHVTSLSVACTLVEGRGWEAELARRGGGSIEADVTELPRRGGEHPLLPILRAASECYNSGRCGGACWHRARKCGRATGDDGGACAGPCGGACACASCSASARPSSSTRTHARRGTVGDEDDAVRVGRSSAAADSLGASCLCQLLACFSSHVHALLPSNLPSGTSGEEDKEPECGAGGLGREGQGRGAGETGKGAVGREEEAVRWEDVMLAPRQEEMVASWLSVCHFTEAPWLACWWLITCREAKQAHVAALSP
jgi:hypothetical protein